MEYLPDSIMNLVEIKMCGIIIFMYFQDMRVTIYIRQTGKTQSQKNV